jgi:hypothetical protein
MITRSTLPTSSVQPLLASEDGHRYFELSTPFFSHAPPRHPAKAHAGKEPRSANQDGQPQKERLTGHLIRACADPDDLKRHK